MSLIRGIDRAERVIEGFETPNVRELLAIVIWVIDQEQATTFEDVVKRVQIWNPLKRMVMLEPHLLITWNRVKEEGWV